MRRKKIKEKIIHRPSTQEIFKCLSAMPCYSKILLENFPEKPYCDFLRSLLEVNFYNEKEERFCLKKLAADFKTETSMATKWIREIYKDILEFNYDKPELFQKEGTKLKLYMKSYDNHCVFYTSLPVVPREYETIKIPFVQGAVGEDQFFVKKVEHILDENEVEIMLWLEAGSVNRYRQFTLDKALFHQRIGFMDVYDMYPLELDDEIRKYTSMK